MQRVPPRFTIGPRQTIGGRIPSWLAADRDRWLLWVPAVFATGIALYFMLPREPPVWASPLGAGLGLLVCLWVRRRPALLAPALCAVLLCLGVAAGDARTAWVGTPLLDDADRRGPIDGLVHAVDARPDGVRVTLRDVRLGGRGDQTIEQPGLRVRLRLLPGRPAPAIGSRIRVFGEVSGPRRPAAPGAFDFRRWSYFQGLSGTGFALGEVEQVAPPAPGGLDRSAERLRETVVIRIASALDPPQSGLAAALLTGERGGVTEDTYRVLRDAGLAHLLAISGLHVGLVAGGVFVALRLGGSLSETMALRYPIKKWAAVGAILAALAYTLLVGAPVPTQRAFLMTGLVLLAVLLDREAISMRLVAWAAVIVLVLTPESLVSASFQMSFAAVIGLVAAYERLAAPLGRWRRSGGPVRSTIVYLASVLISTAVAGLATAPFSIFHFQAVATAGTLANLLAVPLTALWIMPMGVATYAMMPFGLEAGPLTLMGLGIQALVWIAGQAVALAGGSALIPAPPAWGLALFVLGGLWLCLWRTPLRLPGLIGLAVGLASPVSVRPPDLLVNDTARLFAIVDAEGDRVLVSSLRRERFTRGAWARLLAIDRVDRLDSLPAPVHRQDSLGRIVRLDHMVVALVEDPRALHDDCAVADLVVAAVPVRGVCATQVIDRFDVWRHGAHAVRITSEGPRIDTVADHVGDRPWTLAR